MSAVCTELYAKVKYNRNYSLWLVFFSFLDAATNTRSMWHTQISPVSTPTRKTLVVGETPSTTPAAMRLMPRRPIQNDMESMDNFSSPLSSASSADRG